MSQTKSYLKTDGSRHSRQEPTIYPLSLICYLVRGPPNLRAGYFFLAEERSERASKAGQVSQPVLENFKDPQYL